MSLFSAEEICEFCMHAEWHECCQKFCRCKIGKESDRDHAHGTCESKKV